MIAPNNFGAGSSFAFGDVVDLFRPSSTGRRQEAGRKQESRKKTRKQEEDTEAGKRQGSRKNVKKARNKKKNHQCRKNSRKPLSVWC